MVKKGKFLQKGGNTMDNNIISDKERALEYIKEAYSINEKDLEKFSSELNRDDDVIVALVRKNQRLINSLYKNCNNQVIERLFDEIGREIYTRMSKEVLNDRDFMLKVLEIRYDPEPIYYFGDKLKTDLNFLRECDEILDNKIQKLKNDGEDTRYMVGFAESAKNDIAKIRDPLEKKENTLKFLSANLKYNDSKEHAYEIFNSISPELRKDPDIIESLCRHKDLTTAFREELMSNENLMSQVFKYGFKISDELSNDKEFILKAIVRTDIPSIYRNK